ARQRFRPPAVASPCAAEPRRSPGAPVRAGRDLRSARRRAPGLDGARAGGATPLIVVARSESGQPVALLPFARAARGPLRLAVFLGGKDANFNLGLFRSGGAWSRDDVAALLAVAGKRATPRLDA